MREFLIKSYTKPFYNIVAIVCCCVGFGVSLFFLVLSALMVYELRCGACAGLLCKNINVANVNNSVILIKGSSMMVARNKRLKFGF